jgi:hypothetical protein
MGKQTPSGLIGVAVPTGFFVAFSIDWVTEFLAAFMSLFDRGT